MKGTRVVTYEVERLSRRDQFAMAALQGILSGDTEGRNTIEASASCAAMAADALIAELAKEPSK